MALFSASHLKLKRARAHISELRDVAAKYLSSSPVHLSHRAVDLGQGGLNVDFSFRSKPLPEEMSVILGDIVHNIRTSLDLMASDLGGHVSGKAGLAQFPFAEDADGLDEQIKRKSFRLCGDDAVALLKQFRPYRNGNAELRAIHDLDVLDKHKALMPEPHPQFTAFGLEPTSNPDGSVGFKPFIPDEEDLDVQFIMPPNSGLDGRELLSTLEELVQLCEGILEAFAALYPMDETGGQSGDAGGGQVEA